ncbi:MAG: hypothetical protein RIR76_1734 [Verrucomicrobiota bacterium]|jgi:hypothetical protein
METPPPPDAPHPSLWRRWLRALGVMLVITAALTLLALLVWSAPAIHRRFWVFPRAEAAWAELRAQRQPVPEDAGWREFRGVMHSHSELSHDCEVPFPDILRAMEAARLDFIVLSDHPLPDGRASFDVQWRGLHGGRLFIPGFEMRDGLMPAGVRPGITLSNRAPPAELARQVAEHGGLLFFAHPENPRAWELPELAGMEIYNLHTDFKRAGGSVTGALLRQIPDLVLSHRRFPDHLYRLPFRRPAEFLRRWDELNRTRRITGIAGNDCHQNVGFRGFMTPEGTLRVEDTSPRVIKEFPPGFLTRAALRLGFGPLEPGRRLFHVQFDPYERSARYVNTHVLARELTEPAVMESLRESRVFVAFDLIADSSGFRWSAEGPGGRAVMGETLPFAAGTRLRALAPIPGRFTLVKDGAALSTREGRSAEWIADGPGKYRVEVELSILGDWTPWIYANPIQLR